MTEVTAQLATDDSPTKRFGPCVEGANVHHNPRPGPGDGDWLYGHNWDCLAMLMSHPLFGIIALPLLSLLYVRKVDIEKLKQRYELVFRTKHELVALDLCRQVMRTPRAPGSRADRWGIEEHFHDVKEAWGTGERQVRSVCSSIGCWELVRLAIFIV